MLNARIIPCLLLQDRGLVKTVKFEDAQYVGDPINAVKIFNDKFVDEIIFLDISASKKQHGPNFDFISEITSECFIPFCYGGGIKTLEDAKRLFNIGVEKISINSAVLENPCLISELAEQFGSQSIVVSMDVKKNLLGKYMVMSNQGKTKTSNNPVEYAQAMQKLGAGEILINDVDRDGTMKGYDIKLLKEITRCVTLPVIACGGAGSLDHIKQVVLETGVSAAAGSIFVFKGKHKAVLINYPSRLNIKSILGKE